MVRTGEVISLGDREMTIAFIRPEACEKCGLCGERQRISELKLPKAAQLGDFVEVELPEGRVAQGSMLAYTVPLIFLMAGLLSSTWLKGALNLSMGQDAFAAIMAGIGLLVGLGAMGIITRLLAPKRLFEPHVVAVYPAVEGSPPSACSNENTKTD